MTEILSNDYEVSSEGCVRHWEVPYARMEDATPTVTFPACVIDDAAAPGTGVQVCGTILTVDATNSVAIIDFTAGMVYRQAVRNVATYAGNVEATWAAIQFGAPIYYDRSNTMPATSHLSLSPLDRLGVANPLFGYAVGWSDADAASFPKAVINVASTTDVAVMQRGAGA
ncbi:MAG: hypothetical protein WC657_08735 [Candidatus Paceibacterota bacterium]|jgi:hypothetical protein